ICEDGHGEASHVCARPRDRIFRRTRDPRHRAGEWCGQLQLVFDHIGHCEECTISDEESGTMIATKKAISRRAALRGIGAAVALPLLDAMVPALTAAQNTPAKGVRRFGVVYHPNGIIYDKWLPKGVGKDFEFSPILSPLEPFREKVV